MKISEAIPRRHPLVGCKRKNRAFSLVEVVLALGIFAFAVLSIVGLMATGLNSAKDSSTNLAITNINRNLRADLQATPYSSLASATSTNYYFTDGGYPTTQSSPAPSAPFYAVVLTTNASIYPTGIGVPSTNAATVNVKISYPYPVDAQAI